MQDIRKQNGTPNHSAFCDWLFDIIHNRNVVTSYLHEQYTTHHKGQQDDHLILKFIQFNI